MWLISLILAVCTFFIGFIIGYTLDFETKIKSVSVKLKTDEQILKWWHDNVNKIE